MKRWCWGIVWLLVVPCSYAQKKWTGNGNTTYWNNPLNWEGETVPDSLDQILLDNSFLAGSYEVILPDTGVVIQSLEIHPAGTSFIRLLLPVTNTVTSTSGSILPRGFTTLREGYSLILHNNAEFINASGSNSGYSIRISDSIRVENGAKYIHRSRTGHADLINQLSRSVGTEKGVFRMENTDAASTLSISGRVFGSLELSSDASPAGICTYSSSGTNSSLIRGDLVLDSGTVFSLHFSDTIQVNGTLHLKDATLNMSTGNRSSCLKLMGNLEQLNSRILETNLSGSTGCLLFGGNSVQTIYSSGQLLDSILLMIDNTAGLQLLSDLILPYGLTLKKGPIRTMAHQLVLSEKAGFTHAVGTVGTGIAGTIQKRFNANDTISFPLIDKDVVSLVQVANFSGTMHLSYHREDANMEGQQLSAGISTISSLEFWNIISVPDLNSPDPVFEFSYSGTHSGTLQDTAALSIAAFTNNQWSSVRDGLTPGSNYEQGRIRTIALDRNLLSASRFALANKTGGINILPVLVESFWISRNAGYWSVNWELAGGIEPAAMEVELAEKGEPFKAIATLQPIPGQKVYYHTLPIRQTSAMCRVKLIEGNGTQQYSKVLRFPGNIVPLQNQLRLIATASSIQIESREAGRYLLEVYTAAGQLLLRHPIDQPAGIANHWIPLPRKSNQWLLIRLTDQKGNSTILKQIW
ncbi:hypothetical protein L0U88_05065 [Flavihumibacter sp. RY-1]|uniref:Uncharacterized protein n=1 Tax=Flavihumibacter fluminis TaxID=2909236 RepID=A0ABS9BEI8_9BACT|nr:hypothetical protein [Flavihumibacter fluminis]MCF1714002.1 hypothetical protein [Flavihumibacter fluminis]